MSHQIGIAELAVLLVEPSAAQRKIVRRFLAQLGLTRIDEAESIAAALASLARNPVDLVISAMYLPDGTSADLVAGMRGGEGSRSTPLMLVSSENKWRNLDPVRQAGVVAILGKPFAAADLKAALYSALDFLQPPELELELYDIEELRVLVVDDSSMARNHLTRVLRDMGIGKITTARDGAEAAGLVAAQAFDLVVTDYNMPEMDGQQLTEHIRSHSSQSHLPILMVTSEQDGARLSSVRQSGVSAICDKPFEPANVRELLRKILNE